MIKIQKKIFLFWPPKTAFSRFFHSGVNSQKQPEEDTTEKTDVAEEMETNLDTINE